MDNGEDEPAASIDGHPEFVAGTEPRLPKHIEPLQIQHEAVVPRA